MSYLPARRNDDRAVRRHEPIEEYRVGRMADIAQTVMGVDLHLANQVLDNIGQLHARGFIAQLDARQLFNRIAEYHVMQGADPTETRMLADRAFERYLQDNEGHTTGTIFKQEDTYQRSNHPDDKPEPSRWERVWHELTKLY